MQYRGRQNLPKGGESFPLKLQIALPRTPFPPESISLLPEEFRAEICEVGKSEAQKMDSSRSRLNLPAGMEASLHLDLIPTRFPAIPKTPSPSKTIYSDRFIPCRSSSRLQNFALVEKSSPVKEGGNEAYTRLLRAELFGPDSVPSSPGGQGSPISPNKNLFRFKTDHSASTSPFSGVASGQDGGILGEVTTPPKVPRKVPKTPHKVTTNSRHFYFSIREVDIYIRRTRKEIFYKDEFPMKEREKKIRKLSLGLSQTCPATKTNKTPRKQRTRTRITQEKQNLQCWEK